MSDHGSDETARQPGLRRRPISRRAVTVAGLASLVLAGCGVDIKDVRLDNVPSPPPLEPDASERTRNALRQHTEDLLQSIRVSSSLDVPQPTGGVDTLIEQLESQIVALGYERDPGTGAVKDAESQQSGEVGAASHAGQATTPDEASDGAQPSTAEPHIVTSDELASELAESATIARTELSACDPAIASLAVKISAQQAWWARRVSSRQVDAVQAPQFASAQISNVEKESLGAGIAVRHTAVYLYGVLAASADASVAEKARACLHEHQRVQDLLYMLSARLNFEPPASEPAYTDPDGASQTEQALVIERSVLIADTALVYRGPAGLRSWFAALVDTDTDRYSLWADRLPNLLRIT